MYYLYQYSCEITKNFPFHQTLSPFSAFHTPYPATNNRATELTRRSPVAMYIRVYYGKGRLPSPILTKAHFPRMTFTIEVISLTVTSPSPSMSPICPMSMVFVTTSES